MKEETNKFKIRYLLFIITIIIVMLVLYARYVEPKKLIIKEYRIGNENIPMSFSGIKIVHFSDLFYGNTTDLKDLKKVVSRMNELKPDLVFFTGNLFSDTSRLSEKEKTKVMEELKNIYSTLGKYAVYGKVDQKLKNYEELMLSGGFNVIESDNYLIYNKDNNPIRIFGVSNISSNDFELVDNIKTYNIALVSQGNKINDILNSKYNINLVLSGGSLNGSVVLPFYGSVFIPIESKEYYASYYKRNNTDIYVSSGIGTDKIPYRFLNKPSFNFYRLKSLNK